MGSIVERVGKDGVKSFQAKVRLKGQKVSETFPKRDLAEDWIKLREAEIVKGESVSYHKVKGKLTLADR